MWKKERGGWEKEEELTIKAGPRSLQPRFSECTVRIELYFVHQPNNFIF